MDNRSEKADRPNLTVRIDTARPFLKNTLFSFVDFTILEYGLTVRSATLHQKDGERWLSLPSREYVAAGEKKYAPVLEFSGKESKRAVTNAVLEAFDDFMAEPRGAR